MENYLLLTYAGEELVRSDRIVLKDYDGEPYGDTVPFTVHSNQTIVPEPEINGDLYFKIDELESLNTALATPEATTAAMAALDAAIEAYGEKPYCGGCKAFHTVQWFKDEWAGWPATCMPTDDMVMIIMCDGGDFAPMLNVAYENYHLMNKFKEAMVKRGYVINRLNHFSYGVSTLKEQS